MNASILGRNLARKRKEAGLSQADVAARMGTSQAAISRLESGTVTPTVAAVDRFARAVGRQIEVVFGEAPTPVTREVRRRRVELALGRNAFNPWDRDPTPAEVQSLLADGLTRDYFESAAASRGRR